MGQYFFPPEADSPLAEKSASVSPRTSKTLPKTSGPTGTMMGLPVSVISSPRFKPSVEDNEIARMRPGSKCFATSKTMRPVWVLISSAFKRAGKGWFSPNSTSTTGPMI